MGTTKNLNLTTHTYGIDLNESFEEYRMDLNGDVESNMTKIDDWAGTIPTLLSAPLASAVSSVAILNSFIDSASGSVAEDIVDTTEIATRLTKLGEFSGSGQADFNGISQDYTHLIIFGIASVNYGGQFADVGIDINGSTSGSMYDTMKWTNSGSSAAYTEAITRYTAIEQILIGQVSGSLNANYGGPIIAVIPNYSSGSGFYKSAMGISALTLAGYAGGGFYGGEWKDTAPITRIRIFGSSGSTTKYDFITGTTVSLYGLK